MKIDGLFLRHIQGIFGPLKSRMLFVLSLIGLSQVLQLAGPYIQGAILDNLSQGKAMTYTYWLIALAVTIRLVNQWVLQFPREKFEINKVDFDIQERAGDQTMEHVTNLSVGQHNMLHSGTKQSVINRGQSSMTNLVTMAVYEIAPTLMRCLALVIALFYMSPLFGFVVLVTLTLFTWLTVKMNNSFGDKILKLERMWNVESKFRGEILQNISHVLVNAQEKKAQAEANAKFDETVSVAKPLWNRFILYAYLKNSVIIAGSALVMFLGAYYIYNDQYTIGKVVVLWYWSNDALNSVGNIGSMQRQIMRMWTSIRRYCEFLDLKNDVTTAENPIVFDSLKGDIEFRDVKFFYQSRIEFSPEYAEEKPVVKKQEVAKHPALNGITLRVKAGETIGIVGQSGSGKTTLVQLALRSHDPSSGQILMDGEDLRNLDIQKFRSSIGVVEQTVPLFDRSIKDNILYGLNGHAVDVTHEELERAATMAQISQFAHKLEQGFDTIIGERGIKLSGGERQRIGIARALIKNPAILIFDEATSSLDAGVEAEIREAIKEASIGRTTIIIAHRFSTIRYVDRIVVMDEGMIVGEGKHDDLYETCPIYRKLVDHQVVQK